MDWLDLAEKIVIAASLVMAVVNFAVAAAVDRGYTLPKWLLWIGSFGNVAALNLDKALRFLKGYRGKSLKPGA